LEIGAIWTKQTLLIALRYKAASSRV